MNINSSPLDKVIQGDCLEVLPDLNEELVDMVFADPPYNLQLQQELWRPNLTKVSPVDEDWDQFDNLEAYDHFTRAWLKSCKRIMKKDATIWIIGTYHNIFRIGAILQEMGFWILNDVVWIKTNPMPNFRGVRLTNAHETLIWACKSKDSKYRFNYRALKAHNDGLQMRSDWTIPICTGPERIKINGVKAHPTQKPEALLYRVIQGSTKPGDLILDPFFGTGTSGAVAKRLHRHFIGIEKDEAYINIARQRISDIKSNSYDPEAFDIPQRSRRGPRISTGMLLEKGFLQPGQPMFFRKNDKHVAKLRADGHLILDGFVGSIHQAGRYLLDGVPCNGWDLWFYKDELGNYHSIDDLRKQYRALIT